MNNIVMSKHLWRLLAANKKIVTNFSKYNENRKQFLTLSSHNYYKNNDDIDAEMNKPLQYTTSPAHNWKAAHSRTGSAEDTRPWYEPHCVSVSLIIFMVYFFIIREENDIDLLLDKPLTDTLKME